MCVRVCVCTRVCVRVCVFIYKSINLLRFLCISKLDISYPMNQFRIQGFQHFRLDISSKGGGLIMYIRYTIPAKQLTLSYLSSR